jgi:hypothetical protein
MSVLDSEPDIAVNDTLFEVYVREGAGGHRDEFAIGEHGTVVYVLERFRNSEPKIRKTDFAGALKRLAGRLKDGFEKHPERMYFNPRASQFTRIHPDVDWKGEKWLLAATPGSVPAASDQVAARVATLSDQLILPEEVEAWRKQQQFHATHVVAFADHPAWVLGLGQLALENGWGLRSSPNLGPCPDMPPSMAPLQWQAWLVPTFEVKALLANQAGFGWTVGQIVVSDSTASQSNRSALL